MHVVRRYRFFIFYQLIKTAHSLNIFACTCNHWVYDKFEIHVPTTFKRPTNKTFVLIIKIVNELTLSFDYLVLVFNFFGHFSLVLEVC